MKALRDSSIFWEPSRGAVSPSPRCFRRRRCLAVDLDFSRKGRDLGSEFCPFQRDHIGGDPHRDLAEAQLVRVNGIELRPEIPDRIPQRITVRPEMEVGKEREPLRPPSSFPTSRQTLSPRHGDTYRR